MRRFLLLQGASAHVHSAAAALPPFSFASTRKALLLTFPSPLSQAPSHAVRPLHMQDKTGYAKAWAKAPLWHWHSRAKVAGMQTQNKALWVPNQTPCTTNEENRACYHPSVPPLAHIHCCCSQSPSPSPVPLTGSLPHAPSQANSFSPQLLKAHTPARVSLNQRTQPQPVPSPSLWNPNNACPCPPSQPKACPLA